MSMFPQIKTPLPGPKARAVIELRPLAGETPWTELAPIVRAQVVSSARPAAAWLQAFVAALDEPGTALPQWERLIAAEQQTLLEHPAVAAAGVVGRADEAHGEEVVAFVELRPGQEADTDGLVAFAKERIGSYKYPREVHVVPSLPLTPVGKVDRKKLRERLREEATA